MATNARHSGMVGYNIQSAVDTETHLIVAHEVTNQSFARDQLSPMATLAKEALARDDRHAIADKGCFSDPEILACHEAGITTTVPRLATLDNAALISAFMYPIRSNHRRQEPRRGAVGREVTL